MRVLVLGATGMLGNTVFREFSRNSAIEVMGTVRTTAAIELFEPQLHARLVAGVDALDFDSILWALAETRPDVIVNCIGAIKQKAESKDPVTALSLNSLLPHRLARLCRASRTRLVHISTDCVFAGTVGMYRESDLPDAPDLYGRTKLLGEVSEETHVVTLRTSIIGHELLGARSLLGWFLAQEGKVHGYTEAFFSGLPASELSRLIREFVLVRADLNGLYHVSAERINKFDLLTLIARIYEKKIDIEPLATLRVDRSLDSTRFRQATGYAPPAWSELIGAMKGFA